MAGKSIRLNPRSTQGVGRLVFSDEVLGASTTTTVHAPKIRRGIPQGVPESQLYYWSHAWQAGEREALADLAAGRSREFSEPVEAIRWLLSTEDD